MGFLIWLEESGLGTWARLGGYPPMIALHAIGMAVMVGLALGVDLRMLGMFPEIPYTALQRFLGIAWFGFGINLLSGAVLFTTQATTYISSTAFLLKIGFVILGVFTTGLLQAALSGRTSSWSNKLPGKVKGIASLSIAFWMGAIISGRLIAYYQ